MLKINLLFKKFINFTGKLTREFLGSRMRNFQGSFYMNTNIKGDFQICISFPLIRLKPCNCIKIKILFIHDSEGTTRIYLPIFSV